MGCSGSVPKAEAFLTNEQPAPPNGYLHDGVPTEDLTIQAWSNFDPGNRYHAQSGALGALQTIGLAMEQHGDNSSSYTGSTLEDAVGSGGVGSPETLTIAASGAQIATLSMPPHMAFGIAAVLRDLKGGVIAIIATAQRERPSGFSPSSVNIWGTKPIPGQPPTDIGGIAGYLWGKAERGRMSNTFTISRAISGCVFSPRGHQSGGGHGSTSSRVLRTNKASCLQHSCPAAIRKRSRSTVQRASTWRLQSA
jgi:hypothetical protein